MNDQPHVPPLLEVIAARRSLRAFTDQAVPDEVLQVVFEAARWAPSSGNGQPWRFVVTRQGTDAFERLAMALRSGNAWAKRAPVLALAATKTMYDKPGKPPRQNRRALLELGLALENLLLQATHEGMLAHPMAGFDADAAAEATGMPDDHQVGVLVALGYPGDPATLDPETREKDERPRSRQPQADFVFEGEWRVPAGWTTRGDDG